MMADFYKHSSNWTGPRNGIGSSSDSSLSEPKILFWYFICYKGQFPFHLILMIEIDKFKSLHENNPDDKRIVGGDIEQNKIMNTDSQLKGNYSAVEDK